MTRTIRLLPMLTVVVLLGAGQARADSVDFSYAWTVQPQNVFPSGTGSVALSVATDPVSASAQLGSSTPTLLAGATVTSSSSATGAPDSFNASFSMTLHLTDSASNQSADLSFSGTLAGQLTSTTSTLTTTLDSPFSKSLSLGDHTYTLTIVPTLLNVPAPGKTGPDGNPAAINGNLTVANRIPVDPPPHQTPEPTSLVLGATAVLGLAARRLWLRRRNRAATV
jgi:hypothetical protein